MRLGFSMWHSEVDIWDEYATQYDHCRYADTDMNFELLLSSTTRYSYISACVAMPHFSSKLCLCQ